MNLAGSVKKKLKSSALWPALRFFYHFALHPGDEWHYAVDYLKFQRRYGSLGKLNGGASACAQKVLIVALHEYIPSVKTECLWSLALKWRGAEPWVLLNRQSRAEKYYRVFGVKNFLYFDDFMEKTDRAAAQHSADALLGQAQRFGDLVACRFRDVHVGRHALSTVLRRLHAGTLDLGDSETRRLLRDWMTSSIRAIDAAEAIFRQFAPDLLLFVERGYTPFGEIFDVALQKNINTVQYFIAHYDDAYIFKRYTPQTHDAHPVSLSGDTWTIIKRSPWTKERQQELYDELYRHYAQGTWFNFQRLQHGKTIKSKEEIQKQFHLDPAKKTAVIYSHMLWDATFFYGESLFDTYEEWLIETVRQACRNPRLNWLLRLHPVNVWRLEADNWKEEMAERVVLRRAIGTLPEHVKLLDPGVDINTYSFFHGADYCLTVRGTIGLECAAYGTPVITAGTGRYSHLGFTYDSASPSQYLELLSRLETVDPLSDQQKELAQKYLYYLLKKRPLPLNSFRVHFASGKNVFYPLNGELILSSNDPGRLREAHDLKAFAEWALDKTRGLDFLID